MSEFITQEDNEKRRLHFSYTVAFDVIRQSYIYIFIAALVFLIGIYLGTKNPTENYRNIVHSSLEWRTKLQSLGEDGSIGMLALLIFLSNSLLAARAIWFSFVIGIYPVADALLSGKLIGSYFYAFTNSGISPIHALVKIAPHGMLEIPALLVSSGVGMWCFQGLLKSEFRNRLSRANRVLILLVLPAIAIAAIIEAKNYGL